MNFSPFLSLAAFRPRSSGCDTRSRPCVRCVFCSLAFPSAPPLCSTGFAASATDVASALFVGFPAPIAGSDYSRSCFIGYGSSPSRCGPAALDRAVERELSRFPETKSVCTCQVLRPRWAIWTLAVVPIRVAFRQERRRRPRSGTFAAQWLACAYPCRRFACTLTGTCARLRADADRYSFIVVDFHPLLLAGFTGALSCSFNSGHAGDRLRYGSSASRRP